MKSRVLFSVPSVALVLMSNLVVQPAVQATPLKPDWINGAPIVQKSGQEYSTEGCVDEVRQVALNRTMYYLPEDENPKTWCIYRYNGFDITFYKRKASSVLLDNVDQFNLMSREESGVAISFDGGELVPVQDVSYQTKDRLVYSANSDKVLFNSSCEWTGCTVDLVDYKVNVVRTKNLLSGFYSYTDAGNDWRLKYDDGENVLVEGMRASENGEWASFVVANMGLARMNLKTFEWGLVDVGYNYTIPSWYGGYDPITHVTNDGSIVSLVASTGEPNVVYVANKCGAVALSRLDGWTYHNKLKTTCPTRSIGAELGSGLPQPSPGYGRKYENYFMKGDGSVAFVKVIIPGVEIAWYDLYPYSAQQLSMIDYLALGDSFSSGEGDVEANNNTYYLPGTNVLGSYKDGIPRELCHISSRSYPFLLAKDMGLSRGNSMQSVACSGALRQDVYSKESGAYLGQSSQISDSVNLPRLQKISNATALQNDAIEKFIPGRVRQVELLKKYKPKVATIGVSGNDLGFGHILTGCVLNLTEECYYIAPEGRQELGSAIQANYDKQVELFMALKEASPGTDLYAVGYPQLITPTATGICFANMNSLSQDERTMISEAVTFTNQTIKNAASKAGIKYIHIEDALKGGTLCEGSEAVTTPVRKFAYGAVTSMYKFEDSTRYNSSSALQDKVLSLANSYYRESNESLTALTNPLTATIIAMQEAFHPNAKGHQLIYEYIHNNQSGISLQDVTCDERLIHCPSSTSATVPQKPQYFQGSDAQAEYKKFIAVDLIGSGVAGMGVVVKQGAKLYIDLKDSKALANSPFRVVMRSEERLLAEGTSGGDGYVELEVNVPIDMPIGYHTVVVTALGEGGSQISYIQPVFVVGMSSDDIDSDGIENQIDSCQFLQPSGTDLDDDGIDDMCDINVAKEEAIADAVGTRGLQLNAKSPTINLAGSLGQNSNEQTIEYWDAMSGSSSLNFPSLVSGASTSAKQGDANDKLSHYNYVPVIIACSALLGTVFIMYKFFKK